MLTRPRMAALLAAAAALFVASLWLKEQTLERRAAWEADEEAPRAVLPEADYMPILTLGYRELGASLLYIYARVHSGSADPEDAFGTHDLEPILDATFALDPHFEAAYRWGSLVVAMEDYELTDDGLAASARYLEKAVAHFPDDWEFHWFLGLRYWLDLEGETEEETEELRERGVELVERAMRLPGAPANLAERAAAMRTALGQRERALQELEQMLAAAEDEDRREALRRRYAQLAGDDGAAADLARASAEIERRWRSELPYAPVDLYIALGDDPGDTFDLDALSAPPTLDDADLDVGAAGDRLRLAD